MHCALISANLPAYSILAPFSYFTASS